MYTLIHTLPMSLQTLLFGVRIFDYIVTATSGAFKPT
ncbi:MAG: hypothetical protein RIQ94_3088, partial [Pseudomonadota bacterium]